MKKLTSLLLALLLIISALPTIMASSQPVVVIEGSFDDQEIYFSNLATVDGIVYSYANGNLYQFDDETKTFNIIATTDPEQKISGYINTVVSDGNNLVYLGEGLSFYKGNINNGIITFEPAYSFEKVDMGNQDFYPNNIAICDDYIFANTYGGVGVSTGTSIVTIDKKTGEAKTKNLEEHIMSFSAYKDNKIVFISNNKVKSFDGETVTELMDFTVSEGLFWLGITYDKAKDSIIITDDNYAYVQQGDGFIKAAVLNAGYAQNMASYGDNIAVISEGKVKTFKLDPNNMPEKTIRVYGVSSDDLRKYNEENPNLPAISVYNIYLSTMDAVAKHMKSEDACDVYALQSYMGLQPLVDKQYIAPITSDVVSNNVNKMYPYINEYLKANGNIYYYPIDVVSYGGVSNLANFAYNKAVFEEAGLTEDDVPKTYEQLMDFIDRYQNEISVDYPDIKLMEGMEYNDMRITLMTRILSENAFHYYKRGELPKYDTPIMQKLFTKLNETDFYGFMDFSNIDDPSSFVAAIGGMVTGEPKYLLAQRENIINMPYGFTDMPLQLDESLDIINAAALKVYTVNSLSQNKEDAFKLIDFIAQNPGNEKLSTMLFTDKIDPVENAESKKYYDKVIKKIEEFDAEIEADKAAGGKNVKVLTESRGYLEVDLEYQMRNLFVVNQDEINHYIDIQDTAYVSADAMFDFSSEQMQALFTRYIKKEIDIKSFLSELDRFVTMMSLEGI